MSNMLLESFGTVLSKPIYIIAIILAALGVACALVAKKITKLVRKTEEVKPDDKLLLYIKVAGLGLILVGCLLLIIGALV